MSSGSTSGDAMTDLKALYRKLEGRDSTVGADAIARAATADGAGAPASAEAAIAALARELEADSSRLVADLRGPVVVPFRQRARTWMPAALAAGVAAAALLLMPDREPADAPAVPAVAGAPDAPAVPAADAGDDAMFSMSFEQDGRVADASEAPGDDEVFRGDFDS